MDLMDNEEVWVAKGTRVRKGYLYLVIKEEMDYLVYLVCRKKEKRVYLVYQASKEDLECQVLLVKEEVRVCLAYQDQSD